MKFLADENFPLNTFKLLLELDFDMKHVALERAGISDEEVVQFSIEEQRIILTFDSDFGELVFKENHQPFAVIYLRFKNFKVDELTNLLVTTFQNQDIHWDGFFTVIDSEKIRQRKI